jgi:RHS repeat-associated protein
MITYRSRLASFACFLLVALAPLSALGQTSGQLQPITITGTLPSMFNVTTEGDAMFAIPVSVPPGTAGVQPSLAIAYSSGRQNGLLGKGWALGGLSVIMRCPSTLVPDGVADPVDFDANDQLCLDGARLIVVGQSGSTVEYRTEVDSFAKVVAHGSAGLGPEWFEVRTKDGRIVELGRTPNARIARPDGTTVAWGVSRVSDRLGNFMRFQYKTQTGGGMLAVDRIDYTGNDGAALAPYASVRLVYGPRPDARDMYGPAGLAALDVRLAQIQAYVGDILVRRYLLEYVPSSSTGRSLLASIQECGVDLDAGGIEDCGFPTQFGYESPGVGRDLEVAIADFPGGLDQGIDGYADVNGDGTTDLVFYDAAGRFQVATAEFGPQFNGPSVWLASHTLGAPAQTTPLLGDLNGDGLTDALLKNESGAVAAFISNGQSFGPQIDLATYPAGKSFSILADFDGDGRDDLLNRLSDNRIFLQYSTGTGLTPAQLVHTIPLSASGSDLDVDHPDVNGDGVPDLVYRDGSCVYVILWRDGAYDPFQPGACASQLPGTPAQIDIYFADVNGDGRSDLIHRPKSTNTFSVSLSDGQAFVAPVQWAVRPAGDYLDDAQARFPDFNGDGLADLMYRTTASVFSLQLSTGRSFGPPIDLLTTTGSRAPDQAQFVDTDGDGALDINFRFGDNRFASFRPSQRGGNPDSLILITEGDGRQTTLLWAPLADSSVYTKGSGSTYPVVDVQSSQYVISEVLTNDGLGGLSSRTFTYSEQRRLLGRGLGLGFREMIEIDQSRGTEMRTRFLQDFPLNGMEESVEMRDPSDLLRMSVTSTYASSESAGVYRVALASRVDRAFEGDAAQTLTVARTTEQEFDEFNSPVAVRAFASDGIGTETETTYGNDPDAWIIGVPEEVRVRSFAPNTPDIERRTTFEHDMATGLRTREVREPGTPFELIRSFGYDVFGNLIVTATEASDIETRVERVAYDVTGRFPVQITNAMGHVVRQGFDQRFAVPIWVRDPNQVRTDVYFDALGREVARQFADGTSAVTEYGQCLVEPDVCTGTQGVRFVRKTATGLPASLVVFDVLDREVRSGVVGFDGRWSFQDVEYDLVGRVKRRSLEHFANDPPVWISLEYDALDRVVRQTEPDGSTTTVDYEGLTTTTTNALTQTRTETRNSQDQLVEVVDAMGERQTYTYDAQGNVLTATDPEGNIVRTEYDLLGRRTVLDDPDLGVRETFYDALGQVVGVVDAKGQGTAFVYDRLGRIVFRSEVAGSTEFVFDIAPGGIGKLAAAIGVQASQTHVRRFAYDALSRPLATELTVEGRVYYVINAYDAVGRLDRVTYPTGFQVRQQYNAFGYLTNVRNAATGTSYWQGVARDAAGRYLTEQFGNGLRTQNAFSSQTLQLESVRTGPNGTATVQNLRFGWDRLANLTKREDLNLGKSESFTYDAMNRLTKAEVLGVAPQVFSYDSVGNILSKSDVGIYAYGVGAGPHAVTATAGPITRTYTYDANGNQVARFEANGIQTALFQYSAFDKPTFLTTDGGTRWSAFRYDEGRGILVRRDLVTGSPGMSSTYFVDGVFEETILPQGQRERRHFVRGGDRTIAVVSDAGSGTPQKTRYLHRDHLGSIDKITNESGQVVEALSYDAFGKRRNPDWTPSTQRLGSSLTKGYTGHEQLDHLGLIHMGGRVYDPELARFISADPFVQFPESTQGFNRYAYVENNPLTFVDPSGFGLSRFFKSVGKFFGRILGTVGKITRAIGFIGNVLTCAASFGITCAISVLTEAVLVAFEFGLVERPRFGTARTASIIDSVGLALSVASSQNAQKITGIGGETDIGVGMPSIFEQWSRQMRPDGVIFNSGEEQGRPTFCDESLEPGCIQPDMSVDFGFELFFGGLAGILRAATKRVVVGVGRALGRKAGTEAVETAAGSAVRNALDFGKDNGKLDFLFNRNIDPSKPVNVQRARGMADRIGIADTPANRAEVIRRFNEAFNDPSSIIGPGNVPGSNLREFFLPGVTSTGSRIQFVEKAGNIITIIAK